MTIDEDRIMTKIEDTILMKDEMLMDSQIMIDERVTVEMRVMISRVKGVLEIKLQY